MSRIENQRRFEVFKKDNFTCQYCGRKAPDVVLTIDHVLPLSCGGTDEDDNLITACEECNRGKGKEYIDTPVPEGRTRSFHTRVTPSTYERLKEYSAKQNRSINDVIVEAIEKEIGVDGIGSEKDRKHRILDRRQS